MPIRRFWMTNGSVKGKTKSTVSFTDLDQGSEMIIFESLLTTFTVSFIF
jgi:hypothetical protein